MRTFSILIVDDDHGLARLIEKILRREGFNVTTADSGQKAIEWRTTHPTDLMLIDLKLPDFEAGELIDRLSFDNEPAPFIIITGEGDERIAVEMMKRGALDYLIKDSRFLDLLPVVVQRSLTQLVSRKRLAETEARLQREHEFSDAILATSAALMLVVNAAGDIVRFNRSCEILTGYQLEEVRGKPFWDVFLPEAEQGSLKQNLEEMLQGNVPTQREGYLLTKSGERRLISWSLAVLRGANGAVDFIVACGMDITEYRRLEREILKIVENEQKRIGQDLHDGLCQLLAGIDMMATVLQKKLASNSPADSPAAANISFYAREAIDQARLLARGLSPVELETNGLTSALRELSLISAKIFDVKCTFTCDAPVLVDDNIRSTHLYRIAQESINNAVKHGGAKTVTVRLAGEGDQAVLTVSDDGSGFDPRLQARNGMGLRSMRYRADLLGGNFAIEQTGTNGTTVKCSFPLGAPV